MEQVVVDLARKLGLEAARIWPQAVTMMWAKGLMWTVVDITVCIVAATLAVRLARWTIALMRAPGDARSDTDNEIAIVFCWIGVICLGLVTAAFFMQIPDALLAVLFPEARLVLDLAKGVKP